MCTMKSFYLNMDQKCSKYIPFSSVKYAIKYVQFYLLVREKYASLDPVL